MRIIFIFCLIIVLLIIFVPKDIMIDYLSKVENSIKYFFKKIISYIYNFISSILKNILNEINYFILSKIEEEKIKIINNTWDFIKRILFVPKEKIEIETEEEIDKETIEGNSIDIQESRDIMKYS